MLYSFVFLVVVVDHKLLSYLLLAGLFHIDAASLRRLEAVILGGKSVLKSCVTAVACRRSGAQWDGSVHSLGICFWGWASNKKD